MEVKFTIMGEPVAKGRARVSTQHGYVRSYTPEKTVIYENLVKMEYHSQCKGFRFGDDEPLHIEVDLYRSIPKSTSKKRTALMLEGKIRPITKADLDNYFKSIADALNEIAYKDDSRIVSATINKYYSDRPRVEVLIRSLGVWANEAEHVSSQQK